MSIVCSSKSSLTAAGLIQLVLTGHQELNIHYTGETICAIPRKSKPVHRGKQGLIEALVLFTLFAKELKISLPLLGRRKFTCLNGGDACGCDNEQHHVGATQVKYGILSHGWLVQGDTFDSFPSDLLGTYEDTIDFDLSNCIEFSKIRRVIRDFCEKVTTVELEEKLKNLKLSSKKTFQERILITTYEKAQNSLDITKQCSLQNSIVIPKNIKKEVDLLLAEQEFEATILNRLLHNEIIDQLGLMFFRGDSLQKTNINERLFEATKTKEVLINLEIRATYNYKIKKLSVMARERIF